MCVSVVDIGHRFVYYLNMASVQPKVINGKTYYYLVESARVGGKPRIVSQRYLGSAQDITAALDGASSVPSRTRHLGFGALAATWATLVRLDYAGIVDAVVGLHFVGSLPPADHPELLAVPARDRTSVDAGRYGGLTAFETRIDALGARRRVLLTHSPNLHTKQARGFDQTIAKATRKLTELAGVLERGHGRRDRAGVQAVIDHITRPRWLSRVLTINLTGDTPAQMRLAFTLDTTARKALETELFGKRILVTDRDDWPIVDIVAGYRSQSDAEAGFRQLKDPHVVSFSPMWHWTDSKIRVHLSYCVTALAVAHLMRRQARQNGLDLSVRELLSHLAGIQETLLLYPSTGGRPRARRMLTEMTPTQQQLYEIFNLDQYAPTR